MNNIYNVASEPAVYVMNHLKKTQNSSKENIDNGWMRYSIERREFEFQGFKHSNEICLFFDFMCNFIYRRLNNTGKRAPLSRLLISRYCILQSCILYTAKFFFAAACKESPKRMNHLND